MRSLGSGGGGGGAVDHALLVGLPDGGKTTIFHQVRPRPATAAAAPCVSLREPQLRTVRLGLAVALRAASADGDLDAGEPVQPRGGGGQRHPGGRAGAPALAREHPREVRRACEERRLRH